MLSTKLDFGDLHLIAEDLKLLAKAENRRVLNQATRAGAAVVTREAKKRAPVKTGKLRKNIVTLSVKSRSPNEAASGVHVRGRNPRTGNSDNTMKASDPNNSFYWRFLEMGTSKAAPVPFIRPAYESKESEIERVMSAKLIEAIDKALSR